MFRHGHNDCGCEAAPACATAPVTVGLLPKLDTDPYFGVAKTGAEEAQGEWSIWMWGNGGNWKSGSKWTINSPKNVQTLQYMIRDPFRPRRSVTTP